MPAESKAAVRLAIGHVLFIDIVGYSKLLISEQSELLGVLNDAVREAEEFRSAEAASRLVRLPTGDGMALVFRDSPEQPVRCALEISQALKAHPKLRVRMGIHSGPVNEVADVNERANIAGAGINIAQRVMDCGDAGHILLSKHVAEDLQDYRGMAAVPARCRPMRGEAWGNDLHRQLLHERSGQSESAAFEASANRGAQGAAATPFYSPDQGWRRCS